MYTTKHLIDLYAISHETVRVWAEEFREYLSVSATPPKGARRVFTDSDLEVFSLVADYKRRGLTYADAHTSLRAGQRGDIPNPESVDRLPAVIQDTVRRLNTEIDDLRKLLKAAETERDMARGKVEHLDKLLVEKDLQIRTLYRELAQYEARGDKA
jgi:DNA-binding transcriptional MerR regulator